MLTRFGIPKNEWHLYDIDHNPPYDKDREPDHRKYQLTPRLHREHSRKTAREDVSRDALGRIIGRRGE